MSICEIIEKFYSKYSRNIDFIDFGGQQSDLVEEVMKNLNYSMTLTLLSPESQQKWTKKIKTQSILLFWRFQDLLEFNLRDLIDNQYINPIRILVYCINATVLDLATLRTDLVIPPYYYFIIVDEKDSMLKLWTFENRKILRICHESQGLFLVNEFSSTTLKWIKEPIFRKKYKNFYNCTMILGMFISNFFYYSRHQVFGLQNDIFRRLGAELNFKVVYVLCQKPDCSDYTTGPYNIYNIVRMLTLDGYASSYQENWRWNSVMLNIECSPQLYIPPGDLYTSFEKLALPFDLETWIGIFATFLTAILTVLLVIRLPRKLKKLLFGNSIKNPVLNIFRSFFGIGQTRIPRSNFARLILTFFVLWCLVIRTAFQGKLFEFTTTAIRKPEMTILEELRQKNFTLYIVKDKSYKLMEEVIGKTLRLNMNHIPKPAYVDIYTKNLSDSTFKGVILTCDIEHDMNMFTIKTPMPKRFVPTPITKSYYAIGFQYPNLWNERFEEIMSGLITGGIINWLLQFYTKSKWNVMTELFDTDKVVLNMSHLGFGFQICIFALYGAFLVFLMELLVFWVKKRWRLKSLNLSRHLDILEYEMSSYVVNKYHLDNLKL